MAEMNTPLSYQTFEGSIKSLTRNTKYLIIDFYPVYVEYCFSKYSQSQAKLFSPNGYLEVRFCYDSGICKSSTPSFSNEERKGLTIYNHEDHFGRASKGKIYTSLIYGLFGYFKCDPNRKYFPVFRHFCTRNYISYIALIQRLLPKIVFSSFKFDNPYLMDYAPIQEELIRTKDFGFEFSTGWWSDKMKGEERLKNLRHCISSIDTSKTQVKCLRIYPAIHERMGGFDFLKDFEFTKFQTSVQILEIRSLTVPIFYHALEYYKNVKSIYVTFMYPQNNQTKYYVSKKYPKMKKLKIGGKYTPPQFFLESAKLFPSLEVLELSELPPKAAKELNKFLERLTTKRLRKLWIDKIEFFSRKAYSLKKNKLSKVTDFLFHRILNYNTLDYFISIAPNIKKLDVLNLEEKQIGRISRKFIHLKELRIREPIRNEVIEKIITTIESIAVADFYLKRVQQIELFRGLVVRKLTLRVKYNENVRDIVLGRNLQSFFRSPAPSKLREFSFIVTHEMFYEDDSHVLIAPVKDRYSPRVSRVFMELVDRKKKNKKIKIKRLLFGVGFCEVDIEDRLSPIFVWDRGIGRICGEKIKMKKVKDECYTCASVGKLFRCSICRKIRYCSVKCQSRDWKRHKVDCKKM